MEEYVRHSLPIIKKIAEWERLKGTAACMVSDQEKAEFWDFIKNGFVVGSARAALSYIEGEKF